MQMHGIYARHKYIHMFRCTALNMVTQSEFSRQSLLDRLEPKNTSFIAWQAEARGHLHACVHIGRVMMHYSSQIRAVVESSICMIRPDFLLRTSYIIYAYIYI